MGIFDTRDIYKPFEYPEFELVHNKLMFSFWHPHEVSLDKDINDFKLVLTDDERQIVTRILRNFVQSEVHIGCFWGDFVADWFKKPEIQNVARFISGNESIHTLGYDFLNSSLGLEEYHLLKEDKKIYARIENLLQKRARTKPEILKQIVKFSVFGEGVALFSSFIVLFAFTKKNLFKNLGQIISWSSIDEQAHAEVGSHLVNILKKEYPELWTDEMKENLVEIAENIVNIEMDFIDRIFENAFTDIIQKEHVKNFVKQRANKQLKAIGLRKHFKVDKEMLKNTDFFDIMINGESVHDFFASKDSNYSKGVIVFDEKVWK